MKEKYRREKEKAKYWITTEENKKLFLDFLDRRESKGIGEAFEMKDSTDKDFQSFLMGMYKKWKEFNPSPSHSEPISKD